MWHLTSQSLELSALKETKELLVLYVVDSRELALDEREAVEDHLDRCAPCRAYHGGIAQVDSAIRANREYLVREGVFTPPKGKALDPAEADMCRFMAKLERACHRGQPRQRTSLSRRLAYAAAACLAVGLGLWWGLARWCTSPGTPDSSPVLATSQGPSIKIEQSGPGGMWVLEPGQVIATQAGETKTLVLGTKHRLVMNAETRLSIDPLPWDGKTGHLVNLRFGEILARVEHDASPSGRQGNPFWVQTTEGRAVITGTTFDIKATDQGTTLVVAEGSVCFESEAGAVQVEASQQSTIASASAAPTGPVACDTDALTAWARPPAGEDIRMAQDISGLEQLAFELPSPSPWAEIRTNLHGLDLDKWAGDKRAWFAGQFPWIFQFQEALARTTNNEERTTAPIPDYTTLLIQSGDIWQFRYPVALGERIPVRDPNSLLDLAGLYGLDEQWLIAHALIPARTTQGEQRTTNNEQRTTNDEERLPRPLGPIAGVADQYLHTPDRRRCPARLRVCLHIPGEHPHPCCPGDSWRDR